MSRRVAVVPGDGIGPEITEATLSVIGATGADVTFETLSASTTDPTSFVDEVLTAAKEADALLKGPLGTPLGGGFKSLNVTLRTGLDLYANLRPVIEIPGVGSRQVKAPWQEGKVINFLLVRENLEDLYIGQERQITASAVTADKVMTVAGCERIIRASFELARQRGGSPEVCCAHKANILKETEGMLLGLFREIAPEYPDVRTRELIIDNAAQQFVLDPYSFEVVFMSNLHGDILSDEAAGLIGGLGLAGSANLGSEHAMFEAVHGTAPDIAGKGIANPTSLLMSSVMLLRYLGESEAATRLLNGIFATYEENRVRTGDQRNSEATTVGTKDFADAIRDAILDGRTPRDERFQIGDLGALSLPIHQSHDERTPSRNRGVELLVELGHPLKGEDHALLQSLAVERGGQLHQIAARGVGISQDDEVPAGTLVRLVIRSEQAEFSHEAVFGLAGALSRMGMSLRSLHMLHR